jgi:hypothetical protein
MDGLGGVGEDMQMLQGSNAIGAIVQMQHFPLSIGQQRGFETLLA